MLDGPIESLPWFSPRHDAAGENLSRSARNHPNFPPVRPAPCAPASRALQPFIRSGAHAKTA